MLRPRFAIPVLLIGLLAWAATTFVQAGSDLVVVQRDLGLQLAEVGLPGVGALLLSGASNGYRKRVRTLSREHASAQQVAETRMSLGQVELTIAGIFRDRGNLGQAKHHLTLARDAAPEFAATSACHTAYLLSLKGDASGRAASKRELLRARVQQPENPLPPYLVGKIFLAEKKAKEAVFHLRSAGELKGGDTYEGRITLAYALRMAHDQTKGAEQARRALELARSPAEKREAAILLKRLGAGGPNPWLVSAQAFLSQHRWGLFAILLCVLALISPSLLHTLARYLPSLAAPLYALIRSSEPSAVAAYEAALKRRPNSTSLLRALARAYSKVGVGSQRAAELYERLWQLRPNDREALDQTVRLTIHARRDSDLAVKACQAWMELNATDPDLLPVASYLGRAYRARSIRAPRSALPALETALGAAPSDRELRRYLGGLYSHYGDYAMAVDTIEPLVLSDPADPELRKELARALIGVGDAYTAHRHLRALPPGPEVTIDLYLAGLAAGKAGRHRESRRILEEVLRRDPGLFDTEERIAAAGARAHGERCGPMAIRQTVAAHEAHLLHRAEHPTHGPVLLLTFRQDFSDALDFPALFADSLPHLQQVQGGVAEIIEYGSDEGTYFVVYRPPEGVSLAVTVKAEAPLPTTRATYILTSVLEALEALHAAGQVHGDLRPSAVWITAAGHATLVGAGMSLVAEANQPAAPPGARSPFHVAPEVVQNYGYTVSADIYAAGCLLYELLTGSPPLEGPTHLATMMAHVTIEPEPPSMRVPAIPPMIDQIVMASLAKDPAYRLPSAAEFAAQLRACVRVPESAETADAEPTLPLPATAAPTAPLDTDWQAEVAGQTGDSAPPDPSRWWTFYAETALVATARFAQVFQGFHRPSRAYHAIKHCQPPRALTPSASGEQVTRAAEAVRRLFLNEMHVLQVLSEEPDPAEGIVRIVQTYRGDERSLAYAMPLLAESVAQRVARAGPLPEPEALAVTRQVGQALAGLHRRGIVHRNISPRSVMFDHEGAVHLVGLDRVCPLSDRGPMLLTEREVHAASASPLDTLGDVRYLSPEQCRGEEFDERTDLYSLGCVLVFMLTGWAPFERQEPMQIMLDHLSTAPPQLKEWGATAGRETQHLIDRALAKSPAERFAGMAEMVSAIPDIPLH